MNFSPHHFQHAIWMFLGALIVMFGLSGCFSRVQVYPETWPAREAIASSKFYPCPSLAGSYVDIPTSGLRLTDHDSRHKDHVYLTYNLFGEGRHLIRSRSYSSEDIRQLMGETVEIRQPSPDFIQFIVWRGTGSDRFMLRQKALSQKDGDFTCGPEGLALKTRTEFFFIFATNYIGFLTRTLSRAADGSLIMKITETNMANTAFIIPLGAFDENWLRWAPVGEASGTPNE